MANISYSNVVSNYRLKYDVNIFITYTSLYFIPDLWRYYELNQEITTFLKILIVNCHFELKNR